MIQFPTRFSFSGVSRYEKCPLSYKFKYLLNEPSRPTEPLIKGSEIHDMLEDIMVNATNLQELNAKIAEHSLTKHKNELHNFKKLEAKRQSKYKNIDDYFKHQIELDIFDEDYQTIAKLDRVYPHWNEEGLVLLDYKTGKQRPKENYFLQLAVYTYIYNKQFPDNPIKFWEIDFLSVDSDTNYFIVRADEDMVNKYFEKYAGLVDDIKADKTFKHKLTPLCLWCDYIHICPQQKTALNRFKRTIMKHNRNMDEIINQNFEYRNEKLKGQYRYIYSKIVGTTFTKGLEKVALNINDRLDLVPEPTNEFDPNAIKVKYDGVHLGYIQRDLAESITKGLANKVNYKCVVDTITGGYEGKENIGVNIRIYYKPKEVTNEQQK